MNSITILQIRRAFTGQVDRFGMVKLVVRRQQAPYDSKTVAQWATTVSLSHYLTASSRFQLVRTGL
jgi:hypothetical protein